VRVVSRAFHAIGDGREDRTLVCTKFDWLVDPGFPPVFRDISCKPAQSALSCPILLRMRALRNRHECGMQDAVDAQHRARRAIGPRADERCRFVLVT